MIAWKFYIIFPLHLHPYLLPIGAQLDPTIFVSSQQGISADNLQRLRRGAPVIRTGVYAQQHYLFKSKTEMLFQVKDSFVNYRNEINSIVSQTPHQGG